MIGWAYASEHSSHAPRVAAECLPWGRSESRGFQRPSSKKKNPIIFILTRFEMTKFYVYESKKNVRLKLVSLALLFLFVRKFKNLKLHI